MQAEFVFCLTRFREVEFVSCSRFTKLPFYITTQLDHPEMLKRVN